MSIKRILGLDKLMHIFTALRQNGGITGSLAQLYRTDDLKFGNLIGEDRFGNKYYENPRNFFGRNRWVDYAPHYKMNYDATQVPAEWFGWLHYKTDLPPHQDPGRPKYPWMEYNNENLSGTTGQFTPYSTTRDKIEPWVPPKRSQV